MKQHLAFGLCLLLTGCPTLKHETAVVPTKPPAPVATRAASAAPLAALDAGPPAIASAAEPSEAVWTPPPGDTLHTIACGQIRCRVGQEACAWLATGMKCVPHLPSREYEAEEVYECDEGSDCPTGSICCSQHMGGGFCEPRVGNAPPLYCNSQLCLPNAGAPCPKGTSCTASGDARPGFCAVDPVRATCAPGKRCGAEAGYCVWTYAKGKGQCGGAVDEEALESGRIGVFACTKASDCGAAMRCSTNTQYYTRGTFCSPATEPANSMYVCDTDAQCRSVMEEPYKRAKCVPMSRDENYKDDKFPPWMSICRFD